MLDYIKRILFSKKILGKRAYYIGKNDNGDRIYESAKGTRIIIAKGDKIVLMIKLYES